MCRGKCPRWKSPRGNSCGGNVLGGKVLKSEITYNLEIYWNLLLYISVCLLFSAIKFITTYIRNQYQECRACYTFDYLEATLLSNYPPRKQRHQTTFNCDSHLLGLFIGRYIYRRRWNIHHRRVSINLMKCETRNVTDIVWRLCLAWLASFLNKIPTSWILF
jgi:hypothetical protein